MAEIVNLRQWRKRQARSDSEEKAAQNRAKFGRTKSDKETQNISTTKSARHLDHHLLDPEPDDRA
jgi:hypothetical protein